MNISANKTQNDRLKVAVGLSGGVDSSVAAYLLLQQGYVVTGVYMQCWDEKADGCRAEEDRADAVAVATKLGIKFVSLDFIKEYKSKVIEHFYKEYEAGRTPNPDILCNKEIKFGMFLNWATAQGFGFVATGHYARVIKTGEDSLEPRVSSQSAKIATNATYKLLKGLDESKDQSYFLYTLGQKELSKTLFPVGGLPKIEVRDIAFKADLHTHKKPDSVGICFIGEVDIREFLKNRIVPVTGNVVNKDGKVLGTHDGVAFYTVGQRHGFNITEYVGLPLYVVSKNVEKNELVVGFVGEATSDSFEVGNLSWTSGNALAESFECDVRVRHLGQLHEGVVTKNASGTWAVKLESPIFGVAPGQSAVFYVGDELVGGGIIQK